MKKILSILILVLTLSFSTQAFASLTFTADAITGTTASSIDLGAGNNLLLQTSGGNVGIGTAIPGELLSIGLAGTTKGVLSLSGNISGKIIIQPADTAGTYTLTLPIDAGTTNQVLTTDGNGILSWSTVSGGGGTPGGSNTQVQFNNSGVFGGDTGMTYNTTTKMLSTRLFVDGSNSTSGPNLITNGTFTGSASGWTLGADVTYSNNHVVALYNGVDASLSTDFASVSGETYVITFSISNSNAPVYIYTDNNSGPDSALYRDGVGTATFTANYTGTDTIIFDDNDYTNGDTWELDDVSIFKVDSTATLLNVTGLSGKSVLLVRSADASSIAFGEDAWATRTGTNIVAIGASALNKNTTGTKNVAVGENTFFENTSGSTGVAIGHGALYLNTTGSNNVAIGANALNRNTTGINSIAIGANALRENNGPGNVAIGTDSLSLNTTGNQSIAIGDAALRSNTTGASNIALGVQAGYLSSTGHNNTIIGNQAFYLNTGGSYNLALGEFALYTSNNADDNTALGVFSLYGSTSGNSNTAVGKEAGTSSGSTPINYDNAVTTGSGLTFLGYRSGLGSTTQRNNSSAIGAGAYVDANNTVVLGNGAVTEVLMNSLGTAKVKAGNLKLSSLAVYADNAAALGGGLVAGDVYRTGTGVLMVVY